jgi:hypothetical protein
MPLWHDAGVAVTGADKIDPRQVQGLKRLKHILPLLASLHQVGCERDKAGNRQLHFDEYVTLVLLWLFNPMLPCSTRSVPCRRRASWRR